MADTDPLAPKDPLDFELRYNLRCVERRGDLNGFLERRLGPNVKVLPDFFQRLRVNPGQPHPRSFWAATVRDSIDHPPLEGDRSCDVCGIGCAISGRRVVGARPIRGLPCARG
jgi:hypothetical protein